MGKKKDWQMGSKKKRLERRIITEHAELKTSVEVLEGIYSAYIRVLDATLSQGLVNIERSYQNTVLKGEKELDDANKRIIATLQTSLKSDIVEITPWSSQSWSNFIDPTGFSVANYIRLGELKPDFLRTNLPSMPALLPFVGQKHILISSESVNSHIAANIIESLAWRIVIGSKPGSYQLILLDPLDRGSNLASLLKLPESIRGKKIYCQDDEIKNTLQKLATDIEDVIQKRLFNTYQNVETYNLANPNVPIPYRFLVFVGFPKGFNSLSADLLLSITRSGRRAGVYILGGVSKGEKPPHDFNFSEFMSFATYVSVEEKNRAVWNDPDFSQIHVKPDGIPPAVLIDRLAQSISPLAITSASTVLPFQQLAVRKAKWWQENSINGLQAALGIDQSGETFEITIGKSAHHILLGGVTGTGKTRLLHLLILQLATAYSPNELEFYLVDFKEGVEFQDYVTYSLPHARAVVLKAEREFGVSILQRLVEEMETRSKVFKDAGVNDLQQYRNKTSKLMPRILLIMDEYVVLFSEDDRLAIQANDALGALVMRGRSFGIHILLSAQRPASVFLSMSQIKSQMGVRIALKCLHPDDSALVLGEGNEKATRLLDHGEACITDDPTSIDLTSQVRIAYVSPEDLNLYLRGIQAFANKIKYSSNLPQIVFGSDEPALWLKSRNIAQRLSTTKWLPLPRPTFWLGQPIRIAEDVSITLEQQSEANLLILGADEALAMRMLINCIIGLNLSCKPDVYRVIMIGTMNPGKHYDSILLSYMKKAKQIIQLYTRQDAVNELDNIMKEMDERLSSYPDKPKEMLFVIVAGLHHWRAVRGSNSYTPSPAGEQLAKLWQNGASVGIHTLMWTDRLDTLGTVAGTGTQGCLAAFGHRVGMQMTQDESVNFLGVSDAAKLGRERAYYRNEQWAIYELEKFKPYSLMSQSELDEVYKKIINGWEKM